jgi:hypothetical protein
MSGNLNNNRDPWGTELRFLNFRGSLEFQLRNMMGRADSPAHLFSFDRSPDQRRFLLKCAGKSGCEIEFTCSGPRLKIVASLSGLERNETLEYGVDERTDPFSLFLLGKGEVRDAESSLTEFSDSCVSGMLLGHF